MNSYETGKMPVKLDLFMTELEMEEFLLLKMHHSVERILESKESHFSQAFEKRDSFLLVLN